MNFLNTIPPGVRVVLIFIFLGLFGFGLYYFIFSPKLEMIDNLTQKIHSIQKELQMAMKKKGGFSTISEEEKNSWEKIDRRLESTFPKEEQYPKNVTLFVKEGIYVGDNLLLREKPPRLFSDIITISRQSKILTSIKLKQTGKKMTFNKDEVKWSARIFELSFSCNYSELVTFLGKIAELKRHIVVESLKISKSKIPLINTHIYIKVFYS